MIQKATIITIGDELLIGQVIDTNSAWMATHLNQLCIEISRRIAIADDAAAIQAALDEELPRNDLLLLTGGLGPTADDITKPVLAEYFGGKMVENEVVLAHVKEIFNRNNRPMLETNLHQAWVPESCEVLFNKRGTAPGMWFSKEGKVVVSMPGVPYEMMYLMEAEVLPRLQQLGSDGHIAYRNIITAGEGESFVAERIKDLETALPKHIHLAYLPQSGMLRLRLSGKARDAKKLSEELNQAQAAFAQRLENICLSLEDEPLESILGKALVEKKWMLGLAESCTGGYIAHRITQIAGASKYFSGSIVCYQNEVKQKQLGVQAESIQQYDVVSEAVAMEMAEGARKALGSDIGFGITGMLSGHTDRSPQGKVCMAVCREGKQCSKSFQFYQDRIRNKELAANHALVLIWKFIKGKI
ncbi:MAG: CinA family nicotinamide mononucleotide deamidase-related protein [Bacteroidetes bacterium]|nr:CinA family nicotinamide mononucleotide deamidase-related protein [Bacteroidota bacterium]